MLDAVEHVKSTAQTLRDGIARGLTMEAEERKLRDEQAAEAEASVAARLPTLPNEALWDECGLDQEA
jgi:hypothetical protein